jgi:hypothetical protein
MMFGHASRHWGTMNPGGIYSFTNGNLAAQQATLGMIATNVTGPWEDLAVSSPYTNSFFDPQRFFRPK